MSKEEQDPLRVLHLTTTLDRGGAENYLVDLVTGQIAARNAQIACASLKGSDYWRDHLEKMGVQVVNLNMPYYGAPQPFLRLRRLVEQFRPAIVHCHGAPTEIYGLAAKAGLRNRPKLMITRHEPRIRLFDRWWYGIVDRVITQAADGVLAVSQSVLKTDVERRPALRSLSRVVHHGLDPDFGAGVTKTDIEKVRAGWGIPADAFLIGTIARHTSEKSLDTLLQAYSIAERELGDAVPVRLFIIGRGPLTSELKSKARSLGISDRVVWEEHREDIPAVLRAADIFVLASREEGFGIVLLEAMATSRPIIASRVDAIPEIIVDGVSGFLCTPRNAEEFAERIVQLARNPQLRQEMGRAGHERLTKDFSLETMFDRTINAYDSVLKSDLIGETP